MATLTWVRTTSGNSGGNDKWSRRQNWDPSTSAPRTGDTIQIDQFGTSPYTISYDVDASDAPSLLAMTLSANVTFSFTGGTQALNVNRNAGSALAVNQGQLNVNLTGSTVNASNLAQSGGTIAVSAGTFNVTAQAAISGGAFNLTAGHFNIGTVTAAANTTSLGTGGSLALSGGTLSTVAFSETGGSFAQSGGLVSASGAASFSGGTAAISGGAFTAGTITVSTPITVSGGTMTATAGTFTLTPTGSITMSGAPVLDALAGGFLDNGLIIGSGTLKGTIGGDGTVTASGGKLELTSAIHVGPSFFVSASGSSVLQLDGTVAAPDLFQFIGAAGTLALAAPSSFGGIVKGLVDTDVGSGHNDTGVIDLVGRTIASGTILNGNTLHLVDTTNAAYDIRTAENFSNYFVNWTTDGHGGTIVWVDDTVCYAAGTRILTDQGEIAIEDLSAGDQVITLQDGQRVARPIKWIGTRTIDLTRHPHPEHAAPIRIRRHAFGEDMPRRDLLVSPAHGILIDGKLVPAKMLVNDMTILREDSVASVAYFHVELDRHAILLAEGLPAESYLDTGNRAFFSNAGLALVLHPEFHVNAGLQCWEEDACAPLLVSPQRVQPVWQSLAQRAETLGYRRPVRATTQDAAVHLVADGREIWPVAVSRNRYSFVVPRGASEVRLVSRSCVPSSHSAWLDDHRRLGVAVRSITIRTGGVAEVFLSDHPALEGGWHGAEHENGMAVRRWTDGNALLPMSGATSALMVDIQLDQATTYQLEAETRTPLRRAA